MSNDDQRHDDFDINFISESIVEMSTNGIKLQAEFLPDKSIPRSTMTPVNFFFSAFGL
jgi:hypothetical protein